jgi:hypothetical protein
MPAGVLSPGMHAILPIVAGSLLPIGCRTIPGQDVRYEPTPMPVVRAMLELAGVGPQDVVYDLGAGKGRMVITAAKEFGARGVGIEIDPALVARAQANARAAHVEDKVEFRLGDMYAADMRPATVVTLPAPAPATEPEAAADSLGAAAGCARRLLHLGHWRLAARRRPPGEQAPDFSMVDPGPGRHSPRSAAAGLTDAARRAGSAAAPIALSASHLGDVSL